jgi:Domain of unknown function (DUF1906)
MRQIPAQDIRAAGHAGVINYVSTSRPGSSFGAKPITLPLRKVADHLRFGDCQHLPIRQAGRDSAVGLHPRVRRGVVDARTAWQLHTAAGGGQSAPVFFSVDDDIDRETWNTVVRSGFAESIR